MPGEVVYVEPRTSPRYQHGYDGDVDDDALHHHWLALETELTGMADEVLSTREVVRWHIRHPGRVAPVDVLELDRYVSALVDRDYPAWRRRWRWLLNHRRTDVAVTVLGMLRRRRG